ncbi:MAG: hypothetical protein JWP42_47, partial [Pseudomonas sp.]|nr:hypothetical protein [Pseudomonas sp.]
MTTNTPSDAQLHAAQLEDYELLLSTLRETPTNYVFPGLPVNPLSPLGKVSEDGQKALSQLLRDSDYVEMATAQQIKQEDLSVTLKDNHYVYSTWSNAGHRVPVDLTEHAQWEPLKRRIERSATLLGGALNSSRRISFERMCRFYGIDLSPWTPQKNQAAIDDLQEKIASHHLKLEDDFDILRLRRRPTDKDRAAFRSSRRASSDPSTVDTHNVHAAIIRAEIIDAINAFLPEGSASPLTHLANDILAEATVDQVRATPTVYLQRILQSPQAGKLGMNVLTAMDWHGGKTGEETSPFIHIKVIANALQLWLASQTADNADEIAGYALKSRSNWGKSYPAIRAEFEAHLLTSKRAASEKEAIVIARLFLGRFPLEFRIKDIPQELAYRSSVVWVNFLTGVNIINATEPELLNRMTFQQLVNLPIELAEGASVEESSHIVLARLLPAIDWAQTLGIVESREDVTSDDIDRALSELDTYTRAINNAVTGINEEPPQRFAIAEAQIQKKLGTGTFISDGRKLARRDPGPRTHIDTPVIGGYDYYSFVDVLSSGKFDDQKEWLVTESDGKTISDQWIRIDENRTIKTRTPFPLPGPGFGTGQLVLSPLAEMPDVKTLFDTEFTAYLSRITNAYSTLIKSLLATLPVADREALELGEVRIYSLRKQTRRMWAEDESPEITLPLRARNGLILQATHQAQTTWYEMIPKAGLIHRLDKFDPAWIGPKVIADPTHKVPRLHTHAAKDLPLDWDAHLNGHTPAKNATCHAIIDQLGSPFAAVSGPGQNTAMTFASARSTHISDFIATQFLFVDPVALRRYAKGQTVFEREEAYAESAIETGKIFVPFWGAIEDLQSDDVKRRAQGIVGLFFDVVSFGIPVGKFVAGSVRVVITAGRIGIRASLPAFTLLTRKLVTSLLKALNPIDGIPQLLKALATGLWKLGKFIFLKLQEMTKKLRYYHYTLSLPQLNDVGHWRPLTEGDQLARINGIDDVLVRKLSATGRSDYLLIDPLSSRLYGPKLSKKPGEFSRGQSWYRALEKTDNDIVVELSKKTHVREVFEVDGRTTLYLDNVPYRLDGDHLRRADLIEEDTWKAIPCRVRRAPNEVCETRLVKKDLAPTPAAGTFDETKDWAPWFGDSLYTPAGMRLEVSALADVSEFSGKMQFSRGIYGRVKVDMHKNGAEHTFEDGAIICDSIDESTRYVFTRLNAGDFYVASVEKGQSLKELKFERASELAKDLRDELMTVYIGSLNANNMVRIHGATAVERALKAMDEIAIPIGGHANPPSTLNLIKVDTSPAEAVLFDHSTRMIVRHSGDGASTWSHSSKATDSVRQTAKRVYNTLFQEPLVSVEGRALKTDDLMKKLQEIISSKTQTPVHDVRNIAFAEI